MKKAYIIIIGVGILLSILICTFVFPQLQNKPLSTEYPPLEKVEFSLNGRKIDDFAYWLQDIEIEQVKESRFDLIILDYSADGSEAGEYSKDQVEYMKSSNNKQKLLLSYISIGEAESYRFYWNQSWDADQDGIPDAGAPDWLDKENPDWEGNYKVNYWKHGWQSRIYEYLDRIINESFNGVYMDIIDAYEHYSDNLTNAKGLMIEFVNNISNYVKLNAGNNFSVFVQNGDALLQNSTYLECIDGIGREDLYYMDNEKTAQEWREEGVKNLNVALKNEKVIFIIDYPQKKEKIYDFYSKCLNDGFLPYAASRELEGLNNFDFYLAD